ncbi:GDSL-type esterase/lipase family protein [Leptolyngbya ohadii]|uniref:GDSL-type esterase/lipase family protein n=1 Tax=Leptolyngbya ohadii TaxID=1962290 RepID=UPI001CEC0DE8|nr:GDSL-type esterase/lipase family protein [Leptolyngbya ohadii]
MSQLCLLAAGLMAQGQAPGWRLARSLIFDQSQSEAWHHAEFCQKQKRTAVKPTVAQAERDLVDRGIMLNRPEFMPVMPVVGIATSVSTSARPATHPNRQANAQSHGQSSRRSGDRSSSRPSSGSQLYQQRRAALQAGRLYPRIPINSFQSAWQNATRQPTYEDWVRLLRQEAQVMARSQGRNRLTVLLGDSLLLWFPVDRLPTDRFWLNQGISGDTTAGILRRLPAFDRARPDRIYVMAGINDLRRGSSDRAVLSNLRQIVQRLRRTHPQAAIVVYSILPTRLPALPSDRIQRLNASLAAMSRQEGANFYDLQAQFSGTDGTLRRELTTDGLHLSRQGYEVWQMAMMAIR